MSACKFSVKLIMRNRLLCGRFRNQDFRSQNNYILHLDGFGGLGTTLSDHYATKTLDPTRSRNFETAGGRISAVSLRLRREVVERVPRGGFVVLLARAAQPFSTGGPLSVRLCLCYSNNLSTASRCFCNFRVLIRPGSFNSRGFGLNLTLKRPHQFLLSSSCRPCYQNDFMFISALIHFI